MEERDIAFSMFIEVLHSPKENAKRVGVSIQMEELSYIVSASPARGAAGNRRCCVGIGGHCSMLGVESPWSRKDNVNVSDILSKASHQTVGGCRTMPETDRDSESGVVCVHWVCSIRTRQIKDLAELGVGRVLPQLICSIG